MLSLKILNIFEGKKRTPSKYKKLKNNKSSKFDKIVVLGNSSYQYYLEQLRGPKVCIMSDDISADVLLSYIKCKEPLMPSRTLWVLVTGIEFLFTNSVNMLCSSLRCNYPLQSTLPSVEVALYSNALTTIHEINNELNIIEQNVKRVLNFESDFMFFPPIPPAMIIDSTVAHQDLHRLMVKYPRCYIVTNIIASYFIDIFEKVSFSFAHFTRSALEDMGISADPIKKYFVCHLNQIDFISCGITLPPNKLPFFIEWSNTFRDIISSCAGDSCCFEVSSERESYIYSDDENDETDFESRAVLSEYEKKSLSKVKSDCRIVFEGSSKNKCQYEVIDLTEESDVKSVESAVECKSSTVKAADGTSSRIKGNTVASKNAFDTCSKPFSKDTFEKSVKDPKPKLSVKNVKQPLCKSDIVKQKCSIYEIAADDRPLPFLDSLESDAEPETLTALYEPDPKSEQDMESEIFDNFEEFSESSKDEVIQSDISHLNNSVVLGKNLEFSSSILPLEEESSEEDMHKSSKIEKNSYTSCDDDKSDLGEDIQEQLLIEEELEAEIFGDEECSYDDDDGNDNEDKARDTLEDDIENSSERLYSPAAAEPDRENIPTSKHAYSSLSKEEKLHSNNSDIQIESFLNNVKEVALEINNVSKDKEDLESCESTSVLENDTKISVSETKSDNITKETLNITVGHISECNISSDSIPEDKDFASNDSSQALTHVTINNDLKMD
ncbi:hypothetical protein Avbf_02559 [Armadillidium vulgare]|nr:hypothetical protein Avbf_02559 [Armadillidium vulgare]